MTGSNAQVTYNMLTPAPSSTGGSNTLLTTDSTGSFYLSGSGATLYLGNGGVSGPGKLVIYSGNTGNTGTAIVASINGGVAQNTLTLPSTSGTLLNTSDINLGSWTSYTVTLPTGWSNTTTTASYTQIGKTVHFKIIITLTGAISGTGLSISSALPVTPKDTKGANLHAACVAGSNGYFPLYSAQVGSAINVYVYTASSTYAGGASITANVPVTWQSGNYITVAGTYEAA